MSNYKKVHEVSEVSLLKVG